MPDHVTRDERVLYDREETDAPRRRKADDWGIDESFPRVRARRFARAQEGPPRRRLSPVEDWGIEEPAREPRAPVDEPIAESNERRTIRINGRPGELSETAAFVSTALRRRPPLSVAERLAGDPTRMIAFAFALGLLLILIAIATS